MDRNEITAHIRQRRLTKRLSWAEVAETLGKPKAWTVSALLGNHPLSPEDAQHVVELFELPTEATAVLSAPTYRGSGVQAIPTDPTIYRFYEALGVYGEALKELIFEEFGDGIMSAINFSLEVTKKPDPTGDRVVVTLSGKFLPYEWRE